VNQANALNFVPESMYRECEEVSSSCYASFEVNQCRTGPSSNPVHHRSPSRLEFPQGLR
jgi:hypothetical protein